MHTANDRRLAAGEGRLKVRPACEERLILRQRDRRVVRPKRHRWHACAWHGCDSCVRLHSTAVRFSGGTAVIALRFIFRQDDVHQDARRSVEGRLRGASPRDERIIQVLQPPPSASCSLGFAPLGSGHSVAEVDLGKDNSATGRITLQAAENLANVPRHGADASAQEDQGRVHAPTVSDGRDQAALARCDS